MGTRHQRWVLTGGITLTHNTCSQMTDSPLPSKASNVKPATWRKPQGNFFPSLSVPNELNHSHCLQLNSKHLPAKSLSCLTFREKSPESHFLVNILWWKNTDQHQRQPAVAWAPSQPHPCCVDEEFCLQRRQSSPPDSEQWVPQLGLWTGISFGTSPPSLLVLPQIHNAQAIIIIILLSHASSRPKSASFFAATPFKVTMTLLSLQPQFWIRNCFIKK